MRSSQLQLLALLSLSFVSLCGCQSDSAPAPAPVVDAALPDMSMDMLMDMEVDEGPPPDMMWTAPEDRCPTARSKTQVLAVYEDRVEALTQDERGFKVSPLCTFIDLRELGVSTARGVAQGADEGFVFVYDAGEEGGALLFYTNNGEVVRRTPVNINIKTPAGIWAAEGGFVVLSAATGQLYKFNAEGGFVGPYTPPQQSSARWPTLTDLQDLGADAMGNTTLLATFSDRPPKMFAFPQALDFPESDVGSAWAITLVPSQIGDKIAISGAVGGARGGVQLYRPFVSGRALPIKEPADPLIYAGENPDFYGNGADITPMDDGFFVLDTSESGPRVTSYNTFGIPQEESPIGGLGGTPTRLIRTRIFKDF